MGYVAQTCTRSGMKGEGLPRLHPQLRSYGQLTGAGGRRGNFFGSLAHGRLTMLQQKALHSNIQAAQIGLVNCKNKIKIYVFKECEVGVGVG